VSKTLSPHQVRIHAALRDFDHLPDSAFVRRAVVEGLFGCSPSTVLRWSRSGLIPQPRKLSERALGWNVGELRAALTGRR
jgi:predicted DNA-binding transcriptional regulator AlpA